MRVPSIDHAVPRVLLVDDDPDLLEAYRQALEVARLEELPVSALCRPLGDVHANAGAELNGVEQWKTALVRGC